jgi:hypothetical protein
MQSCILQIFANMWNFYSDVIRPKTDFKNSPIMGENWRATRPGGDLYILIGFA